jgi:hypothetical protein
MMERMTTMTLKNALLAAATLLSVGCAATPTETKVETAADQAQACVAQAKKLWERDVIESLRLLRRGAELRDAESCRQYLAHAETPAVNLSQRLYARLFIEGVIRKGPVMTRGGEDIRGELYYQLCWAWRQTEPKSPSKVKQVLQALLESAPDSDQARSTFIAQLVRETGVRPEPRRNDIHLYAGENADYAKSWMQVLPPGDRRESKDWSVAEANAWGGGTDRLFLGTNVLAFLVNAQGEPSFRGTQLWIVNLGTSSVHLTSLDAGQNNRELAPGRDEIFPLVSATPVTGIPLSVRYRRTLR